MKRYHKATLGDTELTLSLSFKTSLEIKDRVASPTLIFEECLAAYDAASSGEKREDPKFAFDESKVATILAIANEPHENLGFDEIGELVMEHGIYNSYGLTINYISELVQGRSKNKTKEDTTAEK